MTDTSAGTDGPDIDTFLAKPLMAHLASSSPDGPRHSPVWFLWEDGAVWLIGNHGDSFPRRIAQDGRCAIGVVDFDLPRGVLVHVGMRGVAELVELDPERLYRLLSRYLGPTRAVECGLPTLGDRPPRSHGPIRPVLGRRSRPVLLLSARPECI